MNNLEDIKNRLAAATPGEWTSMLVGLPGRPLETKEWIVDSEPTLICSTQIWTDRGKADAEFIAHAPEDIARLVKALESVMEQVEALDGLADQPFSHDVILAFQLASRGIRKAITEALDS